MNNIKEGLMITVCIIVITAPIILGTIISNNDYKKCKELGGKYFKGYCVKNEYFIDMNEDGNNE